jgi:hypothetical protein
MSTLRGTADRHVEPVATFAQKTGNHLQNAVQLQTQVENPHIRVVGSHPFCTELESPGNSIRGPLHSDVYMIGK